MAGNCKSIHRSLYLCIMSNTWLTERHMASVPASLSEGSVVYVPVSLTEGGVASSVYLKEVSPLYLSED